MKQTRGEKVFGVFNVVFLGVVALLCLYPFLYTLSISLSTAVKPVEPAFIYIRERLP